MSARTLIEGQLQRATVAPFDGYVASASARAGDVVSKGQVLAELDDREIRLELARWQAEKELVAQVLELRAKLRDGHKKVEGTDSALEAKTESDAAAGDPDR